MTTKTTTRLNNVTRDVFQRKNLHATGMYIQEVLDIFEKTGKLSDILRGALESGGAEPSMDSKKNRNPMETIRAMVLAAQQGNIRPLERALNAFMLEERPLEEIKHVIRSMTKAVGSSFCKLGNGNLDMLRIRCFDSQGQVKDKMEPIVKIVKELRGEGLPVGIEMAIPYTDGKGRVHGDKERNPYGAQFFADKFKKSLEVLKENGIPPEAARLCIKDMAGELLQNTAEELTKAIIDKIEKFAKANDGYRPAELVLHPHNTGEAAYAAAKFVKVCHDKNQAHSVDVTFSNKQYEQFKIEHDSRKKGELKKEDKKAFKATGFLDGRSLNDALKEEDLELNATEQDEKLFNDMGDRLDKTLEKYEFESRAPGMDDVDPLTGDDYRLSGLPGGGLASTETMILGLIGEKKLPFYKNQMKQVINHLLVWVDEPGGHIISVTPGYQYNLLMAVNVFKNMLDADYITANMSVSKIIEKLDMSKKVTDEEITKYFIPGLHPNVLKFMSVSELPANPHPKIQVAVNEYRQKHAEEKEVKQESRIEEIEKEVQKLIEQGIRVPEKNLVLSLIASEITDDKDLLKESKEEQLKQKKAIQTNLLSQLKDFDWQKFKTNFNPEKYGLKDDKVLDKIEKDLEEEAVSQGIILEGNLAVMKTANQAPDLADYELLAEYQRDKERFEKGLVADDLEKLRDKLTSGEISIESVRAQIAHNSNLEYLEIEKHTTEILKDFSGELKFLLDNKENLFKESREFEVIKAKGVLRKIIEDIITKQENKVIEELTKNHKVFLYTRSQRIDIALGALLDNICAIDNSFNKELLQKEIDHIKDLVDKTKVRALIGGKVLSIDVKEGQKIEKENDVVVATVEAMKMSTGLKAAIKGKISKILVKPEQILAPEAVIATIEPEKDLSLEQQEEKQPKQKMKQDQETVNSLEKRLQQKSQDIVVVASKPVEKKFEQEIKLTKDSKNELLNCGLHIKDHSSIDEKVKEGNKAAKEVIFLINRGSCNAKAYLAFKEAGYDDSQIVILYTNDDATTPLVQQAIQKGQAIKIDSYTAQEDIVAIVKSRMEQEAENSEGYVMPGWGFLAEEADFVEKVEEANRALQGRDMLFAGPNSELMRMVAKKDGFRGVIKEAGAEGNPEYFQVNSPDLEDDNVIKDSALLKRYIDVLEKPHYLRNYGFPEYNKIDKTLRDHFDTIKKKMDSNAVIKASLGGGGKGIKMFRCKNKYHEDNYKDFLNSLHTVMSDSERLYKSPEVMIEALFKSMKKDEKSGKLVPNDKFTARHVEVQIAVSGGKAVILGNRDCTPQTGGQKRSEHLPIDRDFPPGLIERINQAAQKIADRLAELGYTGLGTIELLTDGNGFMFLELNPRLQVEHPVTEMHIKEALGKVVPFPHLLKELRKGGRTPEEILQGDYAIDPQELKKLEKPFKPEDNSKRPVHVRVTSQELDFLNGQKLVRYVKDRPESITLHEMVSKKFEVNIITGGLGVKGDKDSMIGTIYGPLDQVKKAMQEIIKWQEAFAVLDREPTAHHNSGLKTELITLESMFDENYNIDKNLSIAGLDAALERIEKGEINAFDERPKIDPYWPGRISYPKKDGLRRVMDLDMPKALDQTVEQGAVVKEAALNF